MHLFQIFTNLFFWLVEKAYKSINDSDVDPDPVRSAFINEGKIKTHPTLQFFFRDNTKEMRNLRPFMPFFPFFLSD